MSTIQAIDDRNEPIAVLGYVLNACQNLVANTSAANVSAAFSGNIKIVSIVSDQPILLEHSLKVAPNINGNSHYIPANWIQDIKLRDQDLTSNAYVAVKAVAVTANVYISPRS